MLGGEANRPSNPRPRDTHTCMHTHTHTRTTAWLFFLGLYWIGMQSWGERRSEKDLAYKWCPLFDPLGWGGGLVGWGWMGRVVPRRRWKGWETNVSVCEPLPLSTHQHLLISEKRERSARGKAGCRLSAVMCWRAERMQCRCVRLFAWIC